ncbi:hypothetical protein B0H16DRAFT_1463219 [Mycena metata]|uniref:Uncharacterized protein n=1 Tax=Mycena metata TaxID=1033252 RepID=A0AAD7IKL6_9AGAR|nr:hypothetical protein B0H16DRAFT_1463219 [Mycena metata]
MLTILRNFRVYKLQAILAVGFQEKASKKDLHVYYGSEITADYSTSSKKGFPDAGKKGKNARADALERAVKDEVPVLTVVFAASGAFVNIATRTREEIEGSEERERGANGAKLTNSITFASRDIEQPEVGLAFGVANGVVIAPYEDIFGDADLHPERALEFGLGDGSGDNIVVDRGRDGGATVQVAGYAIARVEATVSEVQRGMVLWIRTAGNDAQGSSTVTVGDVQTDLLLGSSTQTTGSEGEGGAAAQGGGAGHGTSGRLRNTVKRGAGMWQRSGRPEMLPKGARETSWGAQERIG